MRWAIITSQHKSLRQAAEALGVRQSTLSRRLRDIEFNFGAVLFERSSGGTRPTSAGRDFLETALHIVEETDAAMRRLKTRHHGETGQLTVGVYASLSAGNLRATLAEHHRRFPEVGVCAVDGDHDHLFCGLANNTIDIAIMTARRPDWDCRRLSLWGERIIVALPAHHPLNTGAPILWQDLAGQVFLFPHRGAGPELERLLASKLHCVDPPHLVYHDVVLDRLLSLVGVEHGLLLMLEGATGLRCDGVVYREVHDEDGPTRLHFTAHWRSTNRNPALAQFLSMLQERYPDLSADTFQHASEQGGDEPADDARSAELVDR